jgi:hypothetical protein
MAISKGKHVDSSRTDCTHYNSKNSSDLGSDGRENRLSRVLNLQNSTNSSACRDDLKARIEVAQPEQQAVADAPPDPLEQRDSAQLDGADIDALLADLDMDPPVETHLEVIESMTAADLDAAHERARVAEEARLQRIRKATDHLEATLAKRALEWRSKNV